MEDKWFLLIRDTIGIAGNLCEVIGVVFLFTQFRKRTRNANATALVKQRSTVEQQ